MWDLEEKIEWEHIALKKTVTRHRILVVESEDRGNGRTMQKFYYLKADGRKGAYGEDLEYGDFPWENRSERTRVA
jgi:hypothetical protein